MSLISPISFQSPESIDENTANLGIIGEEDIDTTRTRAMFALGKESDLIPDESAPSGFILGESITDILLRASINYGGGFMGDIGVTVFAPHKLRNDFLTNDRIKQKLKAYLDEKIIIPQGVTILNQEGKEIELFFGLQELFIVFLENYKYSTQQDCDRIFDEFMEILSGVPEIGIEDILDIIRVKLAEVHPTTFNFAGDYGTITGATKQEVGRLVSLEKALRKIDLLPPASDMPKRTLEEIDGKFIAWQEEAKNLIMMIIGKSER